MVVEQQLDDVAAELENLGGVRLYYHALGCGEAAGGDQIALALNIHETDAASALSG